VITVCKRRCCRTGHGKQTKHVIRVVMKDRKGIEIERYRPRDRHKSREVIRGRLEARKTEGCESVQKEGTVAARAQSGRPEGDPGSVGRGTRPQLAGPAASFSDLCARRASTRINETERRIAHTVPRSARRTAPPSSRPG